MEKPFSPAADRNKEVIFETLLPYLESFDQPKILEVGSATGQHGLFFSNKYPQLEWIFCDQEKWQSHLKTLVVESQLSGPYVYQAGSDELPKTGAQFLYSSNTLHIMSWSQAKTFLKQTADILDPGGVFIYYGPFNEGERFTSPSNEAFDQKLKSENPDMGIRDRFEVQKILELGGLQLEQAKPMPANNFTLIFKKTI